MRLDLTEVKAEVSEKSVECPTPEKWLCYDGMATELEVLNFIEALVVLTKPNIIVETGTWYGYGTIHLAHAVKANKQGIVYSAETDSNILSIAKTNILQQGMLDVVELHHGTGIEMINSLESIDFAFLDSGDGDTRCAELKALLPKLNGFVVIHDTGSTHAGWRDQVFASITELSLKSLQFATPRGLTLAWR
jgi:predicted O-methyltransferase YrrM